MAEQYRKECENCGRGYLKMHTKVTRKEVSRLENDRIREAAPAPEEHGDATWVRCNNCGHLSKW